MTTNEYLEKVKQNPESLDFTELMRVIDSEYEFTPTAFKNGEIDNTEEQNSGSCKLFSFALMHDLTVDQTLACFGAYYREDVLQNPRANDHQNIRSFMQNGWTGIEFSGAALELKDS